MAGGWMPEKYFWRSGREKCFSLDIPFYRTSELTIRRIVIESEHAQDLPEPNPDAFVLDILSASCDLHRFSVELMPSGFHCLQSPKAHLLHTFGVRGWV
jgi:hypothetical protein